ncbi:hypothetical protein [Denitrobaculum tricleocarpae]|uniref:AsmA family protein n=1 Tax=Denitrobaculum tricleocarpae TaxID=2591009 RepID=A0A545TU85_9PROT|nr:hypothetical protein [Denitrobaculum tricleocarpae]TQV80778.1 hypothetical protein FKG95_11545 [Denitrobaculum tricleocarpae]
MKRFLTIGGGVVAVIATLWFVVATFVFPSIGSVVKAAVEKIGSDLTQTTVRLDDAQISLTDGRGSLHGLHMTNPSGFEDTDAFAFELIAVQVDLTTITSDVVVIDEIIVEKPRIRYEIGQKGTNIDTIRGNVESQQSAGTSSDDGPGRSFIIKNLYLRDGTVSVAATGLFDEQLAVPLPDIHLTDVGQDGAGASPGDIVEQTLAAVGSGITTAVADVDLDSIRRGAEDLATDAGEVIEDAAEETGKAASDVGEAIGEGAEQAGEAISEGAESAGEAIKSLFD